MPHLGLLVCRGACVCVCACARASACGRACIGTAVCECVRACIGTAADSLDLQGARNAPCNLVLTHLGLLVCRGVCVCVCVCMCELCVCVCVLGLSMDKVYETASAGGWPFKTIALSGTMGIFGAV